MDRLSSSASIASSIDDYSGHNMWTSTWPKSHYLVTFLLFYSVARRRCSFLRDDTLGTTVHKVLFWCGTIATLLTSTCYRPMQIFVSVCMQKKVFVRSWEMIPKVSPISLSWSCHLVHCSPRLRLLEFLTSLFIHRRLRFLWSGHRSASKHCC